MSALESRGRERDFESVDAEEEAVEEASRGVRFFRLEVRREFWALDFCREFRREFRCEGCLRERDRRGLSVDSTCERCLVWEVLGAPKEGFFRNTFGLLSRELSGERIGCFLRESLPRA